MAMLMLAKAWTVIVWRWPAFNSIVWEMILLAVLGSTLVETIFYLYTHTKSLNNIVTYILGTQMGFRRKSIDFVNLYPILQMLFYNKLNVI